MAEDAFQVTRHTKVKVLTLHTITRMWIFKFVPLDLIVPKTIIIRIKFWCFKKKKIASFIHCLIKFKQLFTKKNSRLDTLNNDHMFV